MDAGFDLCYNWQLFNGYMFSTYYMGTSDGNTSHRTFFNNIFIAFVWMGIEVFMIFYVWPEYCSKWALRMTMRVAVYPVKCVKKCVLRRKEAVAKSRQI